MADDFARIEIPLRNTVRGYLGCLALVLIPVVAFSVFVYFQFHPRNRVLIEVSNVPAGTRFICVVAEVDNQVLGMNWSPQMIAPFEMEPANFGGAFVMHDGPVIANRHVMWKFGSLDSV